jgi:CRISPR-associated protein (TIGR03986 family)
MEYIKAPFNFVPVSKEVFYPGWADQISHDLPFSDGLSGKITLTIEAKTPIFIRDSESKTEFCHVKTGNRDKEYFIPGTSIKGMVRNVLEIMSFGKLSMDEKMRFATREWDKDYIYNLKKPQEQKNVRCGWLTSSNGQIRVTDCGRPLRINHIRIDEFLKITTLQDTFKQGSSVDLNDSQLINNKVFDPKTACYKYALLEDKVSKLRNKNFKEDKQYIAKFHENRVMPCNNETDLKGTVVFTGQPDNWKLPRNQGSGKFYEFVFIDIPNEKRLNLNPINPVEFEKFEYLHRNSDDWNYWKNKKDPKGIPVFFRVDGNKIKDFGLAFLYKVPYKYSPKEINDIYQKITDDSGSDLAQCIFGFVDVDKDKQSALKGRVHFSPAKPINTPVPFDHTIKTTLGSPRASYYPIYIVQTPQNTNGNKVEKYITYNDKNAQLKWKRYPVRNSATPIPPTGNDDVDTEFCPLNSEVHFKSFVRFHNLRPVELGALLSAISFHGNENKLFHSIGMAKSMGFGKIKVYYTLEANHIEPPEYFMAQFERKMNRFLREKWVETEQIKELFTMAWDKDTMLRNVELAYMTMSTTPDQNQFAKVKEFNLFLKKYTELTNTFYPLTSISDEFDKIDNEKFKSIFEEVFNLEDKKEFEKAISLLKEALKIIPDHEQGLETLNRLETKQKFEEIINEAEKYFENGDFKNAREKYSHAKNYTNKPELIDSLISKCTESGRAVSGLEGALNKEGNFDTNIKRIEQYFKKRNITILDERDSQTLLKMIEFWIEMKDPRKKEWSSQFSASNYWKKIASWTGIELAEKWYNHIIKR